MDAAKKLEVEINHYLTLLTERQKEAVLLVVKTFAEEADLSGYSDEVKLELDRRYDEYTNGGKLVAEIDAKNRIESIIYGKADE